MSKDRQVGIWAETLLSPRSESVGQCAEELCRALVGIAPCPPLAVTGISFHAGVASLHAQPLEALLEPGTGSTRRQFEKNLSDSQLLSSDSVEAIISFDCHDALWEWPLRHFGIRSALFVDELLSLRAHDSWDQQQASRYFLRLSRAVESADLVFCDTEATALAFSIAFPRENHKACIVPLGIATTVLQMGTSPIGPRGPTSEVLKRSHTILVTGDDQSRDSGYAFLTAVPLIATRIAPARLIVGAVGPAFDSGDPDAATVERLLCEARKHALVSVSVEGNKTLRRYWGDRADATVLLSPWGDNAVMREMLGWGIPVVSSDAPSHRELAGSAAVFFDPYDAEDMAKKTVEVLKLTREEWLPRRMRNAPRLDVMSWRRAARECLSGLKGLSTLERMPSISLASDAPGPRHSNGPIATLDRDVFREVGPAYRAIPEPHINLAQCPEQASSPREDTDLLIARIFDDIVIHGGLAESVAFSECLADAPSDTAQETLLEWLARNGRLVEDGASCFFLTQSTADCLHAVHAVQRSSLESHSVQKAGKPCVVALLCEAIETSEEVVSGALLLANPYSIATMIVSAGSVVVVGDMASPVNSAAIRLASALGKTVIAVPNSHERHSTGENVFVEPSVQSALEVASRHPLRMDKASTAYAAYPADWRTVARTIRDCALGRSTNATRSTELRSILLRSEVQAWIASAGVHSSYRRELEQLHQYARNHDSSAPTEAVAGGTSEMANWKHSLASKVRLLWHRGLTLRRENSFKARAARLISAADRSRDRGDWAAASVNYQRSLLISPNRSDIWVQLGHALKEQRNLSAATSCYHRALIINDGSADTFLQLGHVLKLQNLQGEAENAYLASLERDRHQRSARLELESMGWNRDEINEELRMRGRTGYFPCIVGEDKAHPSTFHL